jgi:hypothetical protein
MFIVVLKDSFSDRKKYLFIQARRAQEPITSAGKDLIDGACNMILAAKQLAVNPRDPPIYQAYSTHSHSVSEAIKCLVSAVRFVFSDFSENGVFFYRFYLVIVLQCCYVAFLYDTLE